MMNKNSFNLIKDWYFCCCMGYSPSTTQIFLTSLEFLDNPETTRKLKRISLEQIFLIDDISMHIYALPQVLQAFNNKSENREYLLTEGDKTFVLVFYIKLINAISSNQFANLLIECLSLCLYPKRKTVKFRDQLKQNSYNWNVNKSETRNTPYRDIQSYAEPSLLSLFLSYLSMNEKFIEFLKPDESYDLQQFFAKSIEGLYGRFAFGQIIYLPKEVYYHDDEERNLWNGRISNIPEFEPDILFWYANVKFIKPFKEYNSTSSESSKKLLDEYQTLICLADEINIDALRLNSTEFKIREKEVERLLNITGFNIEDTRIKQVYIFSIPFIFWQGILVDLLVKTDPEYAYLKLSELFAPGIQTYRLKINKPDELLAQKLITIYSNLAFYKTSNNSLPYVIWNEKSEEPLLEEGKYLITSPNLCVNIFDINHKHITCFFKWDLSPSLMLLSAFVIPVIRMLQQCKSHINSSIYLGLLIHTKALFHIYNAWLKNTQIHKFLSFDSKLPKLSFPITGLVQSSQRALTMVGCGLTDSIAPELFVNDLRSRFEKLEDSDKNWNNYFTTHIYPGILMIWIQNAMLDFNNNNKGQDRWREKIKDVFNFYKYQQITTAKRSQKIPIALILRMFVPEIYKKEEGFLNNLTWKVVLVNNPESLLTINHRYWLVINDNISIKDWYEHPYWKNDLNKNVNSDTICIIQAIEGLSLNIVERKGINPDMVKLFFDQFEYFTQKIIDLEKFDRFLRIRLLDFINILEKYRNDTIMSLPWERLQFQIVYLLLEFGSLYELGILLNKIFPFDADGCLTENTEFHHLQKMTLNVICRMTVPHLSEEHPNRNAEFPFNQWIDSQKDNLLKEYLKRIGYAWWMAKIKGKDIYLLNHLNLSVKYRDLVLEDARLSETKYYPYSKGQVIPKDWTIINTIIYNPNKNQGRYFIENLEFNEFQKKKMVLNLFRNKEIPGNLNETEVLAYVSFKNNGLISFNCGLKKVIDFQRLEQNITNWYVGMPAIVKITRSVNDWVGLGFEQLPINTGNKIKEFESLNQSYLKGLMEKSKNFKNDHNLEELLMEWIPDFTWLRNTIQYTKDNSALGKMSNDEKNYHPVHFYFDSLLTSEIPITKISTETETIGFTLAFVKDKPSLSTGMDCYIFSSSPGKLHKLYSDDFTNETFDRLEFELKKPDQGGLLVTFVPILDNTGRPVLSLPLMKTFSCENEYYPDLDLPFDFRNIEIRNFFPKITDDHQFFTAERKSNDEWLLTNIPELPHDIKVKFEGEKPMPQIDKVQFVKTNWNPYTFEIIGEIDTRKHLDPINNSYSHFLYRKLGSIVKLSTLISDIYFEYIMRTDEGLEVFVPISTLTMQPLGNISKNNILKKAIFSRRAILTNVYEKKIGQLKINFSSLLAPGFVKAVVKEKSQTIRYSYTIWWEDRNIGKEEQVIMKLVDKSEEIQLGDIVYQNKGGFQLKRWRVSANAIWEENDINNAQSLIYLGEAFLEGKKVFLAESKQNPGKLIILNSDPGVSHLTESNIQGQFTAPRESLNKWCLINNTENESVFLTCKSGKIFGLINNFEHKKSKLQLDEVEIILNKVDNGFLLTRYFQMEIPVGKESRVLSRTSFSTGILKKSFLKGLAEPPMTGECEIEKDRIKKINLPEGLKIPTTIDESRWITEENWTDSIEIMAGESVYIHSRIASYENEKCHFIPVPKGTQEEGYVASFRRVKPFSLSQFIEKRENVDQNYILKSKLFYDGYYENTEFGSDFPALNGKYFHFEYGFGKTLCIPASEVYLEQSETELKLLEQFSNFLFHGDGISNAEIRQLNKKTILLIKSLEIEQSEAHQLYKQGLKKIIHLVYYNPQTDKITKILGIDTKGYNIQKDYTPIGAILSEETKKNLANKIMQWKENKALKEVTFYAKIDSKFRSSGGKKIEFNCLRLHFDHGSDVIKDLIDSLIFVRPDTIRQVNNDYVLDVKPIITDYMQIPEEMKKISILRRDFSCDEETLSRYFMTNQIVNDKIFLVKIKERSQKKGISAVVFDRNNIISLLIRHEKNLISSSTSRDQTYVTYFKEEENSIIVEYKPGIFFRVSKSNWTLPEKLNQGDLLKIIPDNEKLVMKRASFGDHYYITKHPRSIELLPMNIFGKIDFINKFQQRHQDDLFTESYNLTAGSFPNLIFTFWQDITHSDVFALMIKYPKFAEIYKSNGGKILSKSFSKQNEGRIYWKKFLPMKISLQSRQSLDTLLISFMDRLLSDIYKRTIEIQWTYHDTRATIWGKINGRIKVDDIDIQAHTCNTGPLFFHQDEEENILRYPDDEKRNFGYPVREILHYLQLKPEKKEVFYFAGIEYDKQNSVVGIWVEMAPGRIVEIPVDLILIKIDDMKINSTKFDWSLFSIGDELIIRLDLVQGQEREQLILEMWIPRARGLLGKGSIIATVRSIHYSDEYQGQNGISIGSGIFELVLPYNKKILVGTLIKINLQNNKLEIIEKHNQQEILESTVGFLTYKNEVLKISGLEKYRVEIIWCGWESLLNDETIENRELHTVELKEILRVFGILPVTIEQISPETRTIKISRRFQQNQMEKIISENCFSLGRIVGKKNSGQLIIRFGHQLVALNMEQIIDGLTNTEKCIVTEISMLMNDQKLTLKLCCSNENGIIRTGLPGKFEKRKGKPALVFIRPTLRSGIIFKMPDSMELFYVNPNHAVLCEPTNDLLYKAFNRGDFFPVTYTADNFYSIIGSRTVTKWYQNLKINDRFEVNVLSFETMGEKKLCMVKHNNGAIAFCEFFTSDKMEDTTIPITVFVTDMYDHSGFPRIVLKGGDLPFELDFPFEAIKHDDHLLLNENWTNFELYPEEPVNDISVLKIYSKIKTIPDSALVDLKLVQQIFTYLEHIKSQNSIISFLPCLCALSILFRGIEQNWESIPPADKQKSVFFLQYLRLRFLRNLHVEVLSKKAGLDWGINKGGMKERFKIVAERLKILDNPSQKTTFNDSEISRMRTFCKAVYIKEERTLQPDADALLACLGELESNHSFLNEDLLLNELAKIFNILPPGNYIDAFNAKEPWSKIVEETDKIIGAVRFQNRFIPLLPFKNKI